jgi:DNA repair exonuclease SbcCD ATPase subunit
LAGYPADLDAQLAVAREHDACLAETARALPRLRELVEARAALAEALEAEAAAGEVLTAIDAAHVGLATRVAAAGAAHSAAVATEAERRDERTRATTRLSEAQLRRQRFEDNAGEERCSLCGQRIDAEHAADERARLEVEVADAVRADVHASERHQAAETALAETQASLTALNEEHADLERRQRPQERAREAAQGAIARFGREADRAHSHLPTRYQVLVADAPPSEPAFWIAARYPSPGDLEELAAEAAQRGQYQSLLSAIERGQRERDQLVGQRDRELARLAEIEAAYPRATLLAARERQVALTAEHEAEVARLVTARDTHARAEAEAAERSAAVEALRVTEGKHVAALTTIRATQVATAEQQAAALARLPDAWRSPAEAATPDDLTGRRAERDALSAYAEQATELLRARERAAGWERREAECRTEIEALPPEARRPADTVAGELARARVVRDAARQDQQETRARLEQLKQQRARRAELTARHAAADRQRHLHDVLAKLLGRDGLQLHLLRRAEEAIAQHANDILDRLSGGRMRLELRRDGDERSGKALDLLVRDYDTATREVPVGLASGSQRFRIAVSLALAIGRYLGGESQRIQSVIIDEGFGSLDKAGRADMIQELLNLQSHLERIILVSHQEEIADAFPNCYHVRLVDGASRVSLAQEG